MIDTSVEYKTAIKADTEETVFKAEFGFIPPGSVEGSTVSVSAQASASRVEQVRNSTYGMSEKYATCEPDRWILDGTFSLFDEVDATQEVGFWSGNLCGTNGVFASPPCIDYTLDKAYDLIGVMLWFDDQVGEYATSVTVSYYNASNTLLKFKTFTNAEPIAALDLTQTGVKWFRVAVNSWNVGERRAKIKTVLPGQIYYFEKDAFSFQFSEIINPFETSVTFPEYIIKFDNSAKKFDIVNPQGLMAFLRQKMRIQTKISLKTSVGFEDVSTGEFYLFAWPEDTQEDTASFTCRPSMAFENGYYVSPGNGTQTVAQAADIIFAGITEPHTIEVELQSIVVNQNIGKNVPLISAMGQLAVACCGYWKVNRDGTYHLGKWKKPTATNSIDYDNAWEKPQIEQAKRVTSANVKYYIWSGIDERINDYDDIVSLADNTGDLVEINSSFIPSKDRADIVANAALAYYDMRLNYEQEYRGDMAIEAGDNVTVQNDYGTSEVVVLEHVLSWDENGLTGTINGLGV